MKKGVQIILGAISIIMGLVLLPVVAGFINSAKRDWNGSAWNNDPNVTGLAGLSSVLDLVGYGFAFGLVGLGTGMIWFAMMKK